MTRVFDDDSKARFATRAVHAGQRPDEASGAIMTPIYQTSTYVQSRLGVHKGFDYARTRNPTRDALERNVAALEGAQHGVAYASGMAATDAVLKLLTVGANVVCGENVYGGTHRLMTKTFAHLGLDFTFVDTRDVARIEAAISPATRMIFVETPSNPLLRLTDLKAVSNLAKSAKILLVIDNTFATPYLQRPLESGADLVLHSTTKYLNGHSDMVGGIVLTSRDDLAGQLAFTQKSTGAVPGPFDCWLTLRGTKTLALRMRQHDANGRRVAEWLADRAEVHRVYYPGLPSHEQHDLACRQMSGFGGIVSIDLGSLERARATVEATKIFALAESLGGVESIIGHPATMTHAAVPEEMREKMGLTDGLVRLSVGIEDADDLLADLEQALATAKSV